MVYGKYQINYHILVDYSIICWFKLLPGNQQVFGLMCGGNGFSLLLRRHDSLYHPVAGTYFCFVTEKHTQVQYNGKEIVAIEGDISWWFESLVLRYTLTSMYVDKCKEKSEFPKNLITIAAKPSLVQGGWSTWLYS